MSQEIIVNLPKLGESIQTATIVQWFKKEGDYVNLDEPLLEVSTDKVNSEIPAPSAGILKKIMALPDQELDVGQPLCSLSIEASHAKAHKEETIASIQETSTVSSSDASSDFYSPALLRLAKDSGVSFTDLSKIKGSGDAGRVTKKDLENYVEQKKPTACGGTITKTACPHASHSHISDKIGSEEGIEKIKMSSMRKAIAENMKKSFYEAPHATLINEVDITSVLKKIAIEKESFFKEHGVKFTITCFIAKAIADALKEYPLLNASLEGDTILVKKFVNIGLAVSVEGGLMVPVIRDCHKLSILDIAKAVSNISQKTRENKLLPNDVKDGTITLTNFGMSGVSIGVPIIRYPEMAIIGVGAVNKKVVVLEDDTMAIRSLVHLSLTFDHRVIDGMYGCAFLSAVQKNIEKYS